MRGDSRQDLYAKTLALLGLGLLAGTGALVDSWPAANIPAAAQLMLPKEFSVPRPVRATLTNVLEATTMAQVARAGRPSPVAVASTSNTIAALPIGTSVPAVSAVSLVALAEPPAFTSSGAADGSTLDAPRPVTEVPGAEIALVEPLLLASDDDAPLAAPVTMADDDWFLTSAAKKTGASIVRTGVKTGASIADAFRALSGAVRRALPN